MNETLWVVICALFIFSLIPIVPKMMTLRINVLRLLKLNGLADWHERNRKELILVVRVIPAVMALVAIVAVLFK